MDRWKRDKFGYNEEVNYQQIKKERSEFNEEIVDILTERYNKALENGQIKLAELTLEEIIMYKYE